MSAQILDGPLVASEVLEELREPLARLVAAGHTPRIAIVQIGGTPATEAYTRGIRKNCEAVGIEVELRTLSSEATEREVMRCFDETGADPRITGVMLQFPLPPHLDGRTLQSRIPPLKDVEAITPTCLGRLLLGESRVGPCTALATLKLLEKTGIELRGAECVVVGMSDIVGKPSALLLLDRFATTTVCHVETRHLAHHTRRADILVVATGRPHLISADMIKPGAAVIDIGYSRVEVRGENGEIRSEVRGDVVYSDALDVAGWITPVPGGVGPVTRAMLLRNAVTAALERSGLSA
jgi:methylenetetrahydrofolate dehydrogenase (NADP+)/methenyltetrahydrofolate cyclohydrolase